MHINYLINSADVRSLVDDNHAPNGGPPWVYAYINILTPSQ